MKSSVEKLNDTRVKLTVEVPFEELTNEVDQAYKTIAGQVTIPGFRKGKAPRKLIDARFGRGSILEQIVNDMLPSRYEAAVTENDLKVLGQPDIEITKLEDNELVEFTAEVDVRPEIELPDFADISVSVDPLTVTDEQVDGELDALRQRFAELVDSDRELAEGDVAIIDAVVTVDDEERPNLGVEATSYELGTEELYPGLKDALLGAKAGDSVEFDSDLSEDETAHIKVAIQQTKQRKLPELDEEFVQLASEFDTVEELKESIVEKLEQQAKHRQAEAIRDAVMEQALERAPFPLPEKLVEEQAHNALHQTFGELAHDTELIEGFLKSQGSSIEQFNEEAKENATKSLRNQLFLDALVDQNEPTVSREELTDHVIFTAQAYGVEPQQFMAQLQDPSQLAAMYADIARGKALAAAISLTTVTDTDGNAVDVTEYFGQEQEDDATEETTED